MRTSKIRLFVFGLIPVILVSFSLSIIGCPMEENPDNNNNNNSNNNNNGNNNNNDNNNNNGTTGTAPTITTTTLPSGIIENEYSRTLTATGTAPITWSRESGTLPAGLSLAATGAITGTPTTAGTSTFTVKATNAAGSDTKSLSITVASGASREEAIPLTANQWVDGSISTSGGQQWFTFTATASTQYLHVAFGTLSSLLGLYVQVYDSGDATVGNETNLSSSTTNTSRTLTEGQTYYIKVRPYSNTGSGTYRIAFNTSTTPPPVELPTDVITLTANQWADGSIPTSGGQQWFTFTATASTQYLHFDPSGTLNDVYMQVYDSSGAAVGSQVNLFSSTTNTSRTLTNGQTYYIRVMPYSSTGSGAYRIAFNTSTTSPPNAIELPSTTTTLTANQWADGSIATAGGEQWFTFSATASTQYIHFSTSGTLKDVYVQVYDGNGAAVGSETELYSTITRTSRSLTNGQTYYIRVRPYSGSGTYRIGFNTSTTAPTS